MLKKKEAVGLGRRLWTVNCIIILFNNSLNANCIIIVIMY